MKRTEALVRRARAFQRDVLLHDLHDVRLQAEVVDELLRKQTQLLLQLHDRYAPSPLLGGAVANRATSGCCCRNPLSARFNWPVP